MMNAWLGTRRGIGKRVGEIKECKQISGWLSCPLAAYQVYHGAAWLVTQNPPSTEREQEKNVSIAYITSLSLAPPLIRYQISSDLSPKAPSVQLQPIRRIMHFQTLLFLLAPLTFAFALPQSAEDATTLPVKPTVADVAAMCSQVNLELFCCEKGSIGCILINTSVDGTCLPFPPPLFDRAE